MVIVAHCSPVGLFGMFWLHWHQSKQDLKLDPSEIMIVDQIYRDRWVQLDQNSYQRILASLLTLPGFHSLSDNQLVAAVEFYEVMGSQ